MVSCPECNSRNVDGEWLDRYFDVGTSACRYTCDDCGCVFLEETTTKIEIEEHGDKYGKTD